eukprot:3179644-Heterocapsa_arctica.AAC.1
MACQGKALSSIGPQASMPTALPVHIFLMMFKSSLGSSGLMLGRYSWARCCLEGGPTSRGLPSAGDC